MNRIIKQPLIAVAARHNFDTEVQRNGGQERSMKNRCALGRRSSHMNDTTSK